MKFQGLRAIAIATLLLLSGGVPIYRPLAVELGAEPAPLRLSEALNSPQALDQLRTQLRPLLEFSDKISPMIERGYRTAKPFVEAGKWPQSMEWKPILDLFRRIEVPGFAPHWPIANADNMTEFAIQAVPKLKRNPEALKLVKEVLLAESRLGLFLEVNEYPKDWIGEVKDPGFANYPALSVSLCSPCFQNALDLSDENYLKESARINHRLAQGIAQIGQAGTLRVMTTRENSCDAKGCSMRTTRESTAMKEARERGEIKTGLDALFWRSGHRSPLQLRFNRGPSDLTPTVNGQKTYTRVMLMELDTDPMIMIKEYPDQLEEVLRKGLALVSRKTTDCVRELLAGRLSVESFHKKVTQQMKERDAQRAIKAAPPK